MITIGIRKIPKNDTAAQLKLDKIFSKVCPDIKFANNRMDKLNTRNTYDINSINTSNGARAKGAPGGKNKLKKWRPFLNIPNMFIPIKIASAVLNVTIK